MLPERWERIKSLFEEALEHPAAQRADFIRTACVDDEGIRAELERMLACEQVPNDFLECPPLRLPDVILPSALSDRLHQGDVLCGRFQIEEFLGRGGMGEVYCAYDSELRDRIALKTIRIEFATDARRIDLLRREVQQARRVVHPAVCRVYDLFTHSEGCGAPIHFVTMELLGGELLANFIRGRGPLPAGQCLQILTPIAGALTAAHSVGTIHRDLKTGNVFIIGAEGSAPRVVVTDFGLALKIQEEGDTSTETVAGPAGTLAYMAPEQLQGERASVRSDVYSLGLIAYELAAGQQPFSDLPALSAAVKRSHTAPPPPGTLMRGIPPAWDACISKCLDPIPANRYGSAVEFVEALALGQQRPLWSKLTNAPTRRVWLVLLAALLCAALVLVAVKSKATAPKYSSIAVLPFANVGADPETEYLSDGITEQITNALARTGGLRVVSRNSSFRYKGQQNDLRGIARTLGTEMIMTGSVRRAGARIRVSAELVDPFRDEQLWSRSFDAEMKDVFAVQDQIASSVANSLRLQIGRGRIGNAEGRIQNVEAFDLYLKGRYQAARRDETGLVKAVDLIEESVQKDPYYAPAHAELGNCYILMADYGVRPSQEVLPPARAELLRAIELDPELAEAHAMMGQLYSLFDWEWRNAENAYTRAIEINHNYAPAFHWRAQYLGRMGRWKEAMADMHEALRLDPVAIPTNAALGWLYFYAHRFPEARQQAQKTLELNPYFVHAYVLLGQSEAHLGHFAEAKAAGDRAVALAGDEVLGRRYSATIYALIDMRPQAMESLAMLRRQGGARQAAFIAYLCGYLGLRDETFHWLNVAYEQRDPSLPLVKTYPAMDPYRKDPRYIALLEKMKLPPD